MGWRIAEVADLPGEVVALSHFRDVLGASGYTSEYIISSRDTSDLFVERGEQDNASKIGRFPRLCQEVELVSPDMTWPTITFTGRVSIWLG